MEPARVLTHVREARHEDAAAIARVHVDSWRSSYKDIVPEGFLTGMSYEDFEDRWRGWLRGVGNPHWAYRVAELPSDRIVGFASGGPRQGPAYTDYTGELYALYLLREHQRAGIGQRLFGSVARGLAEGGYTSLLAWVLARNPSRRFYEAVGGELLGSQEVEIGGARLEEVAYGWLDIEVVTSLG
jgi:GNAT superfamily N-acetyltransferase